MKEYKQTDLHIVRVDNADTAYPHYEVTSEDGRINGTVYQTLGGTYILTGYPCAMDVVALSCFYRPEGNVYRLAGFFFMEEV